MSTTAMTPWRDRKHLGHPEAGPPALIRHWPAFTLAVLADDQPDRYRVVIVGPTWSERPGHPAMTERYIVPLPGGGWGELKDRLRTIVDARQAAWCAAAGHGPLNSCPLHTGAD